MTLTEWLEMHRDVHSTPVANGTMVVYSNEPSLWHLTSHAVATHGSGGLVILVPRWNG